MYCSKCACEDVGWTGKCPVDGTRLVEHLTARTKTAPAAVPYETIVDLLRKNGGTMEIELRSTDVGRERKFGFPGRGYGFAWARKMHGSIDGVAVDLFAEDVGLKKDWSFPYQGYGFAWERRMHGWIGGHEFDLTATKVAREKKFSFPYRGHGYAWAEEMTGTCGESIKADMRTTEVGRDKSWFLFYFMFGYAWINKATLTLSLVDLPA